VIGQRAVSSSGTGYGAELLSSQGGGENDSIVSANANMMIQGDPRRSRNQLNNKLG